MRVTASFNLIDEPWIPCAMLNGSRQTFGLRDVLVRAQDIAEINGESPLVIAALHRLLLAVLYRNLSLQSLDDWRSLWEQGLWDACLLDAYFAKWRCRFDLFDSDKPFYQAAGLDWRKGGSSARLLFHQDNNPTLFTHLTAAGSPALTPDEAARLLVGFMAFDVGGTKASESGPQSAKAAMLNKGAVVLAKGDNLFNTLMLNLCRYAPEEGDPWDFARIEDIPAWERDEGTRPEDRRPDGYLDLLTWQSRRIRLQPQLDDDEKTIVKNVVIMKGFQPPRGYTIHGKETMLAFRKNQRATRNQAPWSPMDFTEDRALWRDSLALLRTTDVNSERPQTIAWLADLAYEGIISRSTMIPIEILGIGSYQAKIEFWRHERLPLPLAYLDNNDLIGKLGDALKLAEEVSQAVSRVVWTMAVRILAASHEGNPERGAVKNFVNYLGAERIYWSRLELPFKRLMADLPGDMDAEGDYGGRQIPMWRETLRSTLWGAFHEATRGLERSPRTLKALVEAERFLAVRTSRNLTHQEEG